MTLLRPRFRVAATVRPSRARDIEGYVTSPYPTGNTDLALFEWPNFHITGRVEGSCEAPVGTMTASFDVANPDPRLMSALKPGGYFYVFGGYDDLDPDVHGAASIPTQPIFSGNLLHATPHNEGENVVWRMRATSTPIHAMGKCVPKTIEGVGRLPGSLIEEILRVHVHPEPILNGEKSRLSMGLPNLLNPRNLDPIITADALRVPPDYQIAGTVFEEVERILSWLSAVTGHPHYLVPVPDKPHQFRLVDIFEGVEYDLLAVDFEKNLVYSHGPEAQFQAPSGACDEQIMEATSEEDIQKEVPMTYFDYSFTVPFDPRYKMADLIILKNTYLGNGTMVALNIVHNFDGDSATTTVRGPLIDSEEMP